MIRKRYSTSYRTKTCYSGKVVPSLSLTKAVGKVEAAGEQIEGACEEQQQRLPVDDALFEILDQQKTEGTDQSQTGAQNEGSIVDEVQIALRDEGAHCVSKDKAAGQKTKAGCTSEPIGTDCRISRIYGFI